MLAMGADRARVAEIPDRILDNGAAVLAARSAEVVKGEARSRKMTVKGYIAESTEHPPARPRRRIIPRSTLATTWYARQVVEGLELLGNTPPERHPHADLLRTALTEQGPAGAETLLGTLGTQPNDWGGVAAILHAYPDLRQRIKRCTRDGCDRLFLDSSHGRNAQACPVHPDRRRQIRRRKRVPVSSAPWRRVNS
jgi:hypothetical protein